MKTKHEWMIYDASGFYDERSIFFTQRHAKDELADRLHQNHGLTMDGDWKIAKVRIIHVRRKSKKRGKKLNDRH